MSSEIKADKWSPASGTSATIGDSGDTYTIPSGVNFTNNGTATGFGITAANFRPNAQPLIINGDMAVAQRATSVTGITGSGYNTVDRFKIPFIMGTWTQTQESLTSGNAYTDGFSNALKMDCTTADASVGSSDRLALSYNIEGQDLQLLKKGTANAEKVTVSFWIKATKTGTNILELYDNDNNRQISIAYTVSSSNTWEKKVVNFLADTTGVLGDDNGSSLAINWWMGAGSNFSSGTLSTSWSSVTDANRAVGQVNHADSTSNNFHITAVQLEVGEYTSSTLPPFQHESYGDNLSRCQRYYYFHVSEAENGGSDTTISLTSQYNPSSMKGFLTFPTQMRTKPTLKQNTGSNMYRVYENNSNATMTSLTLSSETTYNTAVFTAGSTISVTSGSSGTLQTMDSTAFVAFDAEL